MPLVSQFKLLTNETWKKDWWILLLAKLIVGIFLPLYADEAYYWFWSHHLKLSYFDHPPFIAWLFCAGHFLENLFFAARLPTVLIGSFTVWIWCGYLATDLSANQKRVLLWILSLHTLIGIGSIVANPDVPFLFFWSLSLFFFKKSIDSSDRLLWPVLLGASLGLGFCSKYLIALFVPAAALYLFFSGLWRRVRFHQLAFPTLFGALFSLPVIIWNYQNDWASIGFQLNHGLGREWKPRWTTDFILGTSLLLFWPFIFLYFKNKVFKFWRDLHSIFFSSLLLFFTYTTFKGDTELNWPLMIYPSFFYLIVHRASPKKSYVGYQFFFGILATLLLAVPLFNLPVELHPRLVEGRIYQKIFDQARNYSPLYTSTYQTASYFSFLNKQDYFKLRHSSRVDEFDFLPGSLPSEEKFYFLKEKYQVIPGQYKDRYLFEKLVDLEHNFEIHQAKRIK